MSDFEAGGRVDGVGWRRDCMIWLVMDIEEEMGWVGEGSVLCWMDGMGIRVHI